MFHYDYYSTTKPYEIKHHQSVLSLNRLITETEKLSVSEELLIWSEKNTLAYLNLIDYREKIKSSEIVPWNELPCKEEQILMYTQTIVFSYYKITMLQKILLENNTILLSQLIQKLLTVCNLYSNILTSDKKISLYLDVIRNLNRKRFYHPTSVLNMWNVLCGNSDEAKFYVIGYFLNKSDDTDMLFYILEIAQAVKFNFWGMWFKKNEEDYLCFCPVTAALLQGNANQLAVLLLYGFEQNHGRVAIYDEYYKGEIYSKFKAPLEERNPSRRAILTEILLFLLLIQKEQSGPKFRSLIECFRRVWNINAVPFVTESELMDEIHRRFPYPIRQQSSRLFPHTAPQFIDLVENYYKFIKPEDVPEVVHPRSLQQLCKCSIRKILTRSYKMPEGIARLAIPEKLRKFLKM